MVVGSNRVAGTYKIDMLYPKFKCLTLYGRPDFISISKLDDLPAFENNRKFSYGWNTEN